MDTDLRPITEQSFLTREVSFSDGVCISGSPRASVVQWFQLLDWSSRAEARPV